LPAKNSTKNRISGLPYLAQCFLEDKIFPEKFRNGILGFIELQCSANFLAGGENGIINLNRRIYEDFTDSKDRNQ